MGKKDDEIAEEIIEVLQGIESSIQDLNETLKEAIAVMKLAAKGDL